MKECTGRIYSLKELCSERLNITPAHFRDTERKQLDKLRKTDEVEELPRPKSNSPKYYRLTPLKENNRPAMLLESTDEVKLSKNASEQIEALLKATVLDDVVPIQKELAKVIGKGPGTVKNRMKDMRALGILLPTPTVTEKDRDPDTGFVIHEYERKDCYWYYYDTLPNGNVKKVIDTTDVHHAYSRYFKQRLNYLKKIKGNLYNPKKGVSTAGNYAMKKLNQDFGFYSLNRKEEWNVSEEYQQKILDKYRGQYK
ncbi:hypothetical protein [Halobacillus kuroshimensis]|uniref:hypothetical protein n=1 Tax=Halobacillus kuroshimensis TaxID=302481 RepID=UPI000420330F|nr:hypothetical protein [Halobacillus kuroshimensis]